MYLLLIANYVLRITYSLWPITYSLLLITYNLLINSTSGKVIKIEDWGLLNLAKKIKKYKKGFYIHYKFEGDNKTINEIRKKLKIDRSIIRHLIVRYKKLDTKNEFFKKDN